MKIEYQGAIEARPVFQHVGYVSAASEGFGPTPAGAFGLSLLVLGTALLLRANRRMLRVPWPRSVGTAILGVVALTVGTPLACERSNLIRRYYEPDRAVRVTEFRLHHEFILTDRLVAENGGKPPAILAGAWSAWDGQGDIESHECDTWGTRLRYQRLARPGPDGRRFEVYSAGPDRVFGTADDVHLAAERRPPRDDGSAPITAKGRQAHAH